MVVRAVHLGHVLLGEALLLRAAPLPHAPQENLRGGLEVDDEVGRWEEQDEDLIQLAVGLVVSRIDMALIEEVAGEDFGVFVNRAILNDRAGKVEQPPVMAQAARQEEDLGMERKARHVAIEVGEVRVVRDSLVERLPA